MAWAPVHCIAYADVCSLDDVVGFIGRFTARTYNALANRWQNIITWDLPANWMKRKMTIKFEKCRISAVVPFNHVICSRSWIRSTGSCKTFQTRTATLRCSSRDTFGKWILERVLLQHGLYQNQCVQFWYALDHRINVIVVDLHQSTISLFAWQWMTIVARHPYVFLREKNIWEITFSPLAFVAFAHVE